MIHIILSSLILSVGIGLPLILLIDTFRDFRMMNGMFDLLGSSNDN